MRQRAQRFGKRHVRIWPVQQQQIDLGQAQLAQAFLGGSFQIVRREVGGPHLGGDEHVLAPDARGAQAFADLALVLIGLRGVDVAIAQPERLLDQSRAGSSAQLPGAQPDRGNFGAIGLDIQHQGTRTNQAPL